ncbi:MAG: LPS assembly lipoprotein LptE [Vicinamibacterales bacterium]
MWWWGRGVHEPRPLGHLHTRRRALARLATLLGTAVLFAGVRLLARRPRLVPARLHQGHRRADVCQPHDPLQSRNADDREGARRVDWARQYKIVPETQNVDAVLTGEITGVAIAPLTFTGQQLASRYAITMSARVSLQDQRENKLLWENPSLVFRQEYDAQSGQSATDPAAFFGQDQNALDRMTTEFARSIVSALLEAF